MPELILNTAGLCVTTGTANPVITGTTRKSGPISAIPDGTEVAYYRRYTSSTRAGFENCIGIWRSSTNTIERTSVEKSSNAGSPVVWLSNEQTIDISLNRGMFYSLGRVATVADMVALTGAAVGHYIQVQSYTATNNSGILTFVAVAPATGTADGGSYINGVGVQWKQIFGTRVDTRAWGVGSGLGDDHTRWQAAIDYMSALGGGKITFEGECLLNGNITVKNGVVIEGSMPGPTGYKANFATGNDWGSRIYIAEGYSIILNTGSTVDGFFIHKNGVTFPQTAVESQSWTGTAIKGTMSSSFIRGCMIVGFEYGIAIGTRGDVSTTARNQIVDCGIDCQNGILMAGSGDLDRIINVHVFPFLSSIIDESDRFGNGIEVSDGDGKHIEGCFVFSHIKNYVIHNSNQVLMLGCGSDCDAATTTLTTNVAVEITGDTTNPQIVGCRFIGKCLNVLHIDMTDTTSGASLNLSGNSFAAGCTAYMNIVDATYINVTGCTFSGCTYVAYFTNNPVNMLDFMMSGCSVYGTSYVIGCAAAFYGNIRVRFDPSNLLISTGTGGSQWLNSTQVVNNIASTGTVTIPTTGNNIYNVTGTTTITAFQPGMPGRRVTLIFAGVLTLTQGTSIKLKNDTTRNTVAGERISFECVGQAWYEV